MCREEARALESQLGEKRHQRQNQGPLSVFVGAADGPTVELEAEIAKVHAKVVEVEAALALRQAPPTPPASRRARRPWEVVRSPITASSAGELCRRGLGVAAHPCSRLYTRGASNLTVHCCLSLWCLCVCRSRM